MEPTPTPLTEEAAFEVARDVLTELIAYAGGRGEDPAWEDRRLEWIRRLAALHVTDTAAVQDILRFEAAELAAIGTD